MHKDVITGEIIERDEVIEAYGLAQKLRKEQNLGQRRIAMKIQEELQINVSENTVSGWIHRDTVPFANEETQFQQKAIPSRRHLKSLYPLNNWSASQIAKKYGVSTITAINWLKKLGSKI